MGRRRQQRLFEADDLTPTSDLASSWLSQLGSTGTSATSGQSSVEEPVKRAETAKPKQAMGNKKISEPGTTSSTDGETDKLFDENKQLKKKLEKQNKTVANMKKLSASNKKAQQEVAALKAIIAQGGGQADVQLSAGPTPVSPGGPQSPSELQKKPLQTEPNSKSKPKSKPKEETDTKPRATAKGAPTKTKSKPDATAPAPVPVQPLSPLKRPPSLHVMAQRAKAISPGRTRSDSSPGRGASA